jgi:hypothetical protein
VLKLKGDKPFGAHQVVAIWLAEGQVLPTIKKSPTKQFTSSPVIVEQREQQNFGPRRFQ